MISPINPSVRLTLTFLGLVRKAIGSTNVAENITNTGLGGLGNPQRLKKTVPQSWDFLLFTRVREFMG
jgi:hypothetical protein